MLRFKMLMREGNIIEYEYYPEGESEKGTIRVDVNGEVINIILAANDRNRRYALHLLSRIRKFVKNGKFEEEGMIAWG